VVARSGLAEHDRWGLLEPGVRLGVAADPAVTERLVVDDEPRHALTLQDLGAAAASQRPTGG
jgi:glutamine amidotransferase